jgi:dTDP-4-dehydrorhamnose reductase
MSGDGRLAGKILLTGVGGQVGGELLRVLESLGEVVAPTRAEMDLADLGSVRNMVRSVKPRWVVNAAAYTAVDKAESEPEVAYAINAEAVRVIGEEARAIDAGVIHFSTDYVFDGSGTEPYRETDATGPVSVYGATKLAGEEALGASDAAHLIFRTSWVFGSSGKNFLLTILRLARERESIRVVDDQHGSPTWSRDLARMTANVIAQCEAAVARDRSLMDVLVEMGGVYHAAGRGETTWCGFAEEAVRRLKESEPQARFAEIKAILTSDYPTAAKRPANSRMNCGKLAAQFGWRMMDWRDSLEKVMLSL